MLYTFTQIRDLTTTSSHECSELFSGLKSSDMARVYNIINFARRWLLIVLAFTTQKQPFYGNVAFGLLQTVYAGIAIAFCSFEAVKDNILTTVNEIIFTLMSLALIIVHKEEDWDEVYKHIAVYLIMANILIITAVSIGDLAIQGLVK